MEVPTVGSAKTGARRGSDLDGRACIVTGAGSGIGRATALRFAEDGARVIAVDRDEESVAATAAAAHELPGEVRAWTADVADRQQVAAFVGECSERFGGVDVLVNNAAVNLPALFHEAALPDVERTLAVNVMGVLHACQLAIPHMLDAGAGAIVNVASVNALVAERYLSVYSMSKGAVVMLSRGIALDYADRGIRCNAVCPGWVDTPINHAHAEMLGGSSISTAPSTPSSRSVGRGSRVKLPRSSSSSPVPGPPL